MTGFTKYLMTNHGVAKDETKFIEAAEQVLYNMVLGPSRENRMSEFLAKAGYSIPDTDIRKYYKTYSIPVCINEYMGGTSVIPIEEWDDYYEIPTFINDVVYDDFDSVSEFADFVRTYYGEYDVEDFIDYVIEELE